MANLGVFIFVALVLGAAFFVIRKLEVNKRKRRGVLLEGRWSAEEREALEKDFVLYGKLPSELRDELDGLMHVFLAEKSFEACGDLEEVTPHMQRVIAAQACLLLLRTPHQYYGNLRSILVYPEAYAVEGQVRLGESWSTGSVVLSWASVVGGGRNPDDGHDVSLHEFAHQLDQIDGAGDGVPVLPTRGCYRNWSEAFRPAFEILQKRAVLGKPTVMDHYGAENPAEFFAVATETFFEKPKQLHEKHPEVYAQLEKYYGMNPREWES